MTAPSAGHGSVSANTAGGDAIVPVWLRQDTESGTKAIASRIAILGDTLPIGRLVRNVPSGFPTSELGKFDRH